MSIVIFYFNTVRKIYDFDYSNIIMIDLQDVCVIEY